MLRYFALFFFRSLSPKTSADNRNNDDTTKITSRFDLPLTYYAHQGKYTVTLIEGDGIGPEIAQSVKDIFSAANVTLPPR
jgi:hypothetical protein